MHPDLLSRSEPVRSTRRMGRHSARRIAAACAVLEHPHPRRAGALTYGCPRRARRLQVGAAADVAGGLGMGSVAVPGGGRALGKVGSSVASSGRTPRRG